MGVPTHWPRTPPLPLLALFGGPFPALLCAPSAPSWHSHSYSDSGSKSTRGDPLRPCSLLRMSPSGQMTAADAIGAARCDRIKVDRGAAVVVHVRLIDTPEGAGGACEDTSSQTTRSLIFSVAPVLADLGLGLSLSSRSILLLSSHQSACEKNLGPIPTPVGLEHTHKTPQTRSLSLSITLSITHSLTLTFARARLLMRCTCLNRLLQPYLCSWTRQQS